MMLFALIAGTLISFFWIYYFYRQDKYDKESLGDIFTVFLLSAVFVAFVDVVERFFAPIARENLFLFLILVVGLSEELSKFLPVRLFIYRKETFNEPMDGIFYASVSAAGFMFVENIHYILALSNYAGATGGVFVALARFFYSPFHILLASYWGFELGMAKFVPSRKYKPYVALGASAIMHGLYDYFVSIGLEIGADLLFLFLIVFLYRRMAFALRISPFNRINYLVECIHCKNKIRASSAYCYYCGKETSWLEKEPNVSTFCGFCQNRIYRWQNYCPNCGKKIVWE